MLALIFARSDFGLWKTWVAFGTGMLVTSLVLGLSSALYGSWRRRHRLTVNSREEDLPWEELRVQIEKRNQDRAACGLPPEEATEEELGEMIAKLPALAAPRPLERPEDREFSLSGGDERRAGRRRWGNPTEIRITSPDWTGSLHGLVVNRSTGGLGILADKELAPGTLMTIRAVEAPAYVPVVWIEVRHCLKAGKGFLLGCQFTQNISWSARVWFG
jgi:hypothetical protein